MAALRRPHRRVAQGLAVAFATLIVGLGLAGCETLRAQNCDPSLGANPYVEYDGGVVNGCEYWSSAPGPSGTPEDGELLLWQGGQHYALNTHGCKPENIIPKVSFNEYGTRDGAGENAPAAGEQVIILNTDSTTIYVGNDSCADYWLLVEATIVPGSCASCPAVP
jgi:hypothetical protein